MLSLWEQYRTNSFLSSNKVRYASMTIVNKPQEVLNIPLTKHLLSIRVSFQLIFSSRGKMCPHFAWVLQQVTFVPKLWQLGLKLLKTPLPYSQLSEPNPAPVLFRQILFKGYLYWVWQRHSTLCSVERPCDIKKLQSSIQDTSMFAISVLNGADITATVLELQHSAFVTANSCPNFFQFTVKLKQNNPTVLKESQVVVFVVVSSYMPNKKNCDGACGYHHQLTMKLIQIV